MDSRASIILGLFFILATPVFGFETQDLKGSEALQKMAVVWSPLGQLAGESDNLVDNWKAIGVESAGGQINTKVAVVKNPSGDILYMVKKNDNEIILTFVSSLEILFFPPFDFYVDKKHIFNASNMDMVPILAQSPLQYSGFSLYLNKDFENPGANDALQAFVNGGQAVVEFFTAEYEIAQAAFSLRGSKMAIMEMLMAE